MPGEVDRTAVSIHKLGEEPSDFEYWQSRSPKERLQALEDIRREHHGWTDDTSPDFREFIALLNAHDVRYLVVGEYAVGLHGHPRYTKDIDILIERTSANAERLMQALVDFGFGEVGLTEDDFLRPDRVVQLGRPPNRIGLITSLSGVHFQGCYNRKAVEKR